MKIAALVLAAGLSSRMNQPKLALAYKTSTLMGHAITTILKSKVDAVTIVIGANAEVLIPEIETHQVPYIINPNYNQGLSSSIVTGVKALWSYDAILVALADQPKITYHYYDQILSEFTQHPEHIIASRYGEIKGVPALFPKSQFKALLTLQGDQGAKHYLNQNNGLVKTLTTQVNLMDIDTPDDYQKLQ